MQVTAVSASGQRRLPGSSVLLVALLSVLLCAASVDAQTPTTASTTTTTTTTPAGTIVVGPTTPAPPVLNQDVSRADLLFTFFAQDPTSVQEYSRTLADVLNVSIRRVQFEETGQGRYGYLFGENVRVRVIVDAPSASEDEQRPARTVRDALCDSASPPNVHSRLSDVGVVNCEHVNQLNVFSYELFTAWDVIWTLLIVAGGVAFLSFVAFVVYRFYKKQKFAAYERELEAKEAASKAAAAGGATSPAGSPTGKKASPGSKKKDKKAEAGEQSEYIKRLMEEDDGDEAGDQAMQALVADLARSVRRDPSASPTGTDSHHHGAAAGAYSEAFTAPTDRLPGEAPPAMSAADIDGRTALALHAAHEQQRLNAAAAAAPQRPKSAVLAFVDQALLPPPSAPEADDAALLPSTDSASAAAPSAAPPAPPAAPPQATSSGAASRGAAAFSERELEEL